MKIFGITLGVLVMFTVAAFGNPRIVQRSCNAHVQQVVQQVVTPVVAAVAAVPVAVVTPIYVPTYSVGYAPNAAYVAPADSGPSPQQQLIDEIKALRQDFQQLRTAPSPTPQDPPRKESLQVFPKGLKVMQAKCMSCHQTGKGPTLFKSSTFFIDEGENAAKVLEQINSGKMPPPGKGKLSDAEKYDILWYLTVKETK